jgi:hypothetical protein
MIKRIFSFKAKWIFPILGLGAYLIHLIVGKNSRFIETVYSHGIYRLFRLIWDFTLGMSPLPLIYIFFFMVFIWLIIRMVLRLKHSRSKVKLNWRGFSRVFLFLIQASGGLVFLFYFMWGFNYNRLQIEKHLNLSPIPLDKAALRQEGQWAVQEADKLRAEIQEAGDKSLALAVLSGNLEEILRSSYRNLFKQMDYPPPMRVRVRLFRPGNWMMRVNVSGIYIPYLAEGYIPSTALAVERPFDMAHEMAHALGFTGEDDCNFLAFLACSKSTEKSVAYSGYLNYWLYLSREIRHVSPLEYREIWNSLPKGIKIDIQAIAESWRRFEGPLREVGRRVQDGYLKAQGVREGVLSYNRMVMLTAAWRHRSGRL